MLARVTGLSDEELEERLRMLCAAELLQEAEGDAVTEYRFWHPLTHEVAYGSLLGDRRARLHQAAARAIIELDPDRLNERAALVASHFERASDHLECARWNANAVTWALRSDLNEALRRWRAVVTHLSVASETDETLRLGICARARLLQFGARTGIQPDDSTRLFHEGRALAERLGDVVQLASVVWPFGTVMFLSGDLIGALEHFLEAVRLADQTDDAELRAALCVAPALIYGCIGPLGEGLRLADKAIALSEGDPDRGVQYIAFSPLVRAFLQRADLLALMGRLVDARQNAQRAVDLARERSEPELLAWTLSIYPGLARLVGDADPAVAHGKEAVQISDELGNSFTRALALQALGIAELSRGQFQAASIAFDNALVEARDRNVARFQEASLLSHVARAHLGLKDELAARRVADEAVAVARRQGARVVECFARLTRAQVRRATGADHAAIVADLDAALALVQETGAVTYKPFIHEELGLIREDEAELREALRLYRQTGANGHARRLEAELSVRTTR